MPRINPLSVEVIRGRPDGRTKEGRTQAAMRRALIRQLGGEARMTPMQTILVERCAQIQALLIDMDSLRRERPLGERERAEYLELNSALLRTMNRIGLDPNATEEPPQTHAQWLANLSRPREPA